MRRLINWFRKLNKQEKTMFIFIVLLVVAIITRWGYIKSEAGEALKYRFGGRSTEATEKPDSLSSAETTLPADTLEIPE